MEAVPREGFICKLLQRANSRYKWQAIIRGLARMVHECATKMHFWTRENADRRRPFDLGRRAGAVAVYPRPISLLFTGVRFCFMSNSGLGGDA